MKLIACACLAAASLTPGLTDETVRALRDPTFGDELFVVVERTGDDAAALWDVDDEELEAVKTDSGEVLKPSPFGLTLVNPGDTDPTRKGFAKLGDGRSLLLFRFREPKQPVRSLPRLAGTYELLSGGEERWVDVPFAKVAKAKPWKDAELAAAGFELVHGVREVPQLQLRLAGEVFDIERVAVRAKGADEDLPSGDSHGDLDSITYEFDLGEVDVGELTARIQLDDGTLVELVKLPGKARFTKVKSAALAQAKLTLEVRLAAVRETFAEGAGDYGLLRGYRWVDGKGGDAGIFPSSQSGGGGMSLSTSCRVPVDLPRGVRLQLGILVGAQRETVSFEYTDIAGPDE